jgi:hypothetical protein
VRTEFRTEKCQFRTEKCQFRTEKCQFTEGLLAEKEELFAISRASTVRVRDILYLILHCT